MRKTLLFTILAAVLALLPAEAQVSKPPLSLHKQKTVISKNALKAKRMRKAVPQGDLTKYNGHSFFANLVNSDTWAGAGVGSVPYGIYSYTIGDEAGYQPVSTALTYNFMASAFNRDNVLGVYPMSIMGSLNGVRYVSLDGDNFKTAWEEVYTDVSYGAIPDVMAYDPTSDKIYAAMYNDGLNGLNWAVFNKKTRRFDVIHVWDNDFQPATLAATPDGRLFSIGMDGYYYQIDKATGDAEMLGETGVSPTNYVQSMGYDAATATFLWSAVDVTGSNLYAVDVETGEASKLVTLRYNEQSSSLFFKSNDAPGKAPAAIDDLRFSFEGTAATQGKFAFTVPTKAFDGSSLSADVTMDVYLDGSALVSGAKVAPGSAQSYPVSLSNDNHYVYVLLHNDGGYSPANYLFKWVGNDTPAAVTDVTLSADDDANKFNLTWTAPAKGVNNGYLDFDNLTYDIYRMPDSVKVGNQVKGTGFSEPFPQKMERYYYRVIPFNGVDKQGAAAESNKILHGAAFGVPHSENFDDANTNDLWTVIDGNGDGVTWQYYSWNTNWSMNIVTSGSADVANDWMISPAIMLNQGMTYGVTFSLRNTFAGYPEDFDILVGTNPADTASFTLLKAYRDFDNGGKVSDYLHDVQIPSDGEYYFALRVCSHKNRASGIFFEGLKVDVEGANEAPKAVTELTLTPEESGLLVDTLQFVMPTMTLDEVAMSGTLSANIYRDGSKITTLDNLAPGARATYVDTAVPSVGNHTYDVAAVNAAGEGKKVSVTEFIGVYTPTWTETFDDEASDDFFRSFTEDTLATEYKSWKYNSYGKDLELAYYVTSAPGNSTVYFPAVKLDAESVYDLSFVWNNSVYGTGVSSEVGYSRQQAPGANVRIGDLRNTVYGEDLVVENDIVAMETGKYYPYIKVAAENQNTYLSPSIDSVVVKYVTSAKAPYAVENLTAVPDQGGLLKATLGFTAPTKDYAGRPLTEPFDINIYRGNGTIPVKTFNNVNAGDELSWEDLQPTHGQNVYLVVPSNAAGRGKVTTDSIFVGVDAPLAVNDLAIRGNATNTGVHLTWTAPTKGVNGGVLDNSLTYNIVEFFPEEQDQTKALTILGQTQDLSFDIADVVGANDAQEVHYYYVIPQTSNGVGAANGNYVVLGKVYDLPYKESFTNGAETTQLWLSGSTHTYAQWSEVQDAAPYVSQDGDNGMANFFFGSFYEQRVEGTLVSPKFATDGNDAYVDFWLYQGIPNTYGHPAYLVVKQNVNDGEYEAVSDTILISDSTAGWHKHHIQLRKGEAGFATLQFVAGASGASDYVFIDNIVVSSPIADGIKGIATVRDGMKAVKNGISFMGEAGRNVSVFNLSGVLVDRFTTTGSDIRNYRPGVYLVSVNGVSTKVVVK